MRLSSVVDTLLESYNESEMSTLNTLSKELGLVAHRERFNTVNIQESYNAMKDYIEGYKNYMISGNKKLSKQEVRDNVNRFFHGDAFTETKVLYADIPSYIESYIEGSKTLSSTLDNAKSEMLYNDVSHDRIGYLNTITEKFMDILSNKFNKTLDKLLLESGSRKLKREKRKEEKETHVFL